MILLPATASSMGIRLRIALLLHHRDVLAAEGLEQQVQTLEALEKIAGEKAVILKHAVPAVIGRQREASAGVIAARAGQLAAPLFRMGREWQVNPTDRGFRYESDLMTLDLPAPALAGAHQIDNAATAVACIERLRAANFEIDDAAMSDPDEDQRLAAESELLGDAEAIREALAVAQRAVAGPVGDGVGTALGALAASVLFGAIWTTFGAAAAFGTGAVLSLVATALLFALVRG